MKLLEWGRAVTTARCCKHSQHSQGNSYSGKHSAEIQVLRLRLGSTFLVDLKVTTICSDMGAVFRNGCLPRSLLDSSPSRFVRSPPTQTSPAGEPGQVFQLASPVDAAWPSQFSAKAAQPASQPSQATQLSSLLAPAASPASPTGTAGAGSVAGAGERLTRASRCAGP